MPIYTHEQLMLVDIKQLQSIAADFNLENKDSNDKELLVKEIVAAQDLSPEAIIPVKRKRGRPSKAELAAREVTVQPEQSDSETETTPVASSTIEDKNTTKAETKKKAVEEKPENTKEPENTETTPETKNKTNSQPAAENQQKPMYVKGKLIKPLNEDFLIIEDVQPSQQVQVNTNNTTTTPSPKFHKFKDDPIVQSQQNERKANAARKQEVAANYRASIKRMEESVLLDGSGVLELTKEGYGFLRSADYN